MSDWRSEFTKTKDYEEERRKKQEEELIRRKMELEQRERKMQEIDGKVASMQQSYARQIQDLQQQVYDLSQRPPVIQREVIVKEQPIIQEKIVKEVHIKESAIKGYKEHLFSTTTSKLITSFWAHNNFPEILGKLPITLYLRTRYRSMNPNMMRPEVKTYGRTTDEFLGTPNISVTLCPYGQNEGKVINRERLIQDREEEFQIYIPFDVDGKKIVDVSINFFNKTQNSGTLELDLFGEKS
jgi:hypothetical protein